MCPVAIWSKKKLVFEGKCVSELFLSEWTPVKEVERHREQMDMLLIARGGEAT